MNFKDLAQENENYIIERRRFYHACPEVSLQEEKTTQYIKQDLEKMGLTVNLYEGFYGLTADIVGAKPGKTVALRADIDALQICENTGLEFASTNGNMHACGHDAHIAMLLGAAKMLCETKEQLSGTVRLIFQPAEEIAQGAKAFVAQGVMKGVDAIYGAHIWGNFDAPLISIESGNRMACAARFDIEVEGLSAHGSAPNLGVDAIVAASAIVMALQTYVSRNNDPLNPLVLTVGTIHGGQRFNVIPNKVTMDGTLRTFSKTLLETAPTDIARIIENTALAYGAKASMKFEWLTKPVINDQEHLNKIAQNSVVQLYGQEALGHLDTMMGSEDYSEFMAEAPGVFAFIGSRNPNKNITYTNHHEAYTIDEEVLKRGSAVYAQFAYDFLTQK